MKTNAISAGRKLKRVLGVHILMEFHGCPSDIIKDSNSVKKFFLKAAKISGAHIVNSIFHNFNPHGVSGVVVISESHFSVHTWPEYRYVALDLFSCSEDIDLEKAVEYLKTCLRPKSVSAIELKRGILPA
ncbi:MAG: adenosylmethionine decarboxylase [bacterium]|nr:adenosylmethionine decarboxylase [bacterium]